MNKRQAKKWRKKHFVTVLSGPCFAYSVMNANMVSYSPDTMISIEMTFKNNPYTYLDQENKDG